MGDGVVIVGLQVILAFDLDCSVDDNPDYIGYTSKPSTTICLEEFN